MRHHAQRIDELDGRACHHDFAMVNDADAIADNLRLFHVVRGEENRQPLFLQVQNYFPKPLAGLGIKANGRLVQKKHFRAVQKSASQDKALFLPARQKFVLFLQKAFQFKLRNQIFGEFVRSVKAGKQFQKFTNGEARKKTRLLQHNARMSAGYFYGSAVRRQ